ncbi:MAG: NADH-quinone oxidoreductase subunit J [Planctomycetota bacterium]|nr:NADH-quinone oxidoreductase subunit J [Planctomycetota bacterium]
MDSSLLDLFPPILGASLLQNPQVLFALRVLGVLLPAFLGIYLMLPRGGRDSHVVRLFGGALVTLSFVLLVTFPLSSSEGAVDGSQGTALWGLDNTLECYSFHALAFVSVACAVMMITSRNPVYSAIWFAMVLLSNSGLYLLPQAEFLAAATIIVYAGAIVVTFLFVIMLAQPNGAARYDRFSREGLLSALTGLLLSGVLIAAIHLVSRTEGRAPVADAAARPAGSVVAIQAAANPTSLLPDGENPNAAHVAGLGKSLFRDHVVSVEITGLLLLAAVVGAMLIAGHRIEESHVRK